MTKLKEIKRPDSIAERAYIYQMSLLGTKGGKSFVVSTCKEEVYTMVGKAIGFDYDPDFMRDVIGADWVMEPIDVDKPGIIIYLRQSRKFSAARRINRVLTLLSERQKLQTPKVCLYEGSNAVLIRVDKWYYQGPVALSGLLTFIRAAARTEFIFNTLENFITKTIKIRGAFSELASDDSHHLARAKENGNLQGFLDKTLLTFKHKNGKAWRIGKDGDIPYDGIVRYDSSELSYVDISDGITDPDYDCDI